MDVVKSNFTKVLPLLEDVIRNSVFIALDTEFTGLSFLPSEQPSLFDSINDRYKKLRQTASFFTICQIGLSVYLKDSDENKYIAHSFNFYIFPRKQGKLKPRFGIQAANMEFLCQHKFDFNKWIYEGIPFCTAEEEELVLSGLGTDNSCECIEAIGFRHVFKMLVDAKKPIVGHNLSLDIAYIMDKFHKPLPASYAEFKRTVHSLFPTIIDTKTVCYEIKRVLDDPKVLTGTSLEEVFETVTSKKFAHSMLYMPVINHSKESKKYDKTNCFHEAGFDAYCVGYVFLRLAHLMSMRGLRSLEATPVHFNQYLREMDPYRNKINLPNGPCSFINLDGFDAKTKERGLLVVTSRDHSDLDIAKITNACDDNVEVQLLLPDCALVAVASQPRTEKALSRLVFVENGLYYARHYSWYKDTPKSQLIRWSFKVCIPALGGVLLLVISLNHIWKNYH